VEKRQEMSTRVENMIATNGGNKDIVEGFLCSSSGTPHFFFYFSKDFKIKTFCRKSPV
jgi:hypothetical protein